MDAGELAQFLKKYMNKFSTYCTSSVHAIKVDCDAYLAAHFINFKAVSFKVITRMVKPFDEGHILFERYDITQSLKQKTRAKRAQGKEMEFEIHNEMDIAKSYSLPHHVCLPTPWRTGDHKPA